MDPLSQKERAAATSAAAQAAALVCRQGSVINLAVEEVAHQVSSCLTMHFQSEVPVIKKVALEVPHVGLQSD